MALASAVFNARSPSSKLAAIAASVRSSRASWISISARSYTSGVFSATASFRLSPKRDRSRFLSPSASSAMSWP